MSKLKITSAWLFTLILLGVFNYFPVKNDLQKILVQIGFFLVLPIFYVKIVLGESLGFFKNDSKTSWADFWKSSLVLLIFSGLMFVFVKYSGFLKAYLEGGGLPLKFQDFLRYEVTTVFLILCTYGCFFWGFVDKLVEISFYKYRMFLQISIILLILGLFGMLKMSFLPFGLLIFLGIYLKNKTKTIIYPLGVSWLGIFLMDVLMVKLAY